MVTTTTLLAHLTLVLAVLLHSFDSTVANNECKRKFMAIAAQQCSLGRSRRDLNEALLKTIWNSEEIGGSQDHHPVKRQLGADPTGAIAGMAAPIMEDMISGAISGARRGYQSQVAGRFAGPPPPYPVAFAPVPRVYPGSPQYYVAAPGPAPSIFQSESRIPKGFLPPESGGDLGFDLTPEEVDQLYVAISNRISRNSSGKSPAEVKKVIIQAAAQCCQNIDLCSSKDQPFIHCA